ncbi:MAG: glycosyltransferase [Patescibacteria group bacterium]
MVNVIIPTFNHGNYLPQAIDSVLSQSYQEIEVIVVDDGSTDNTRGIVEGYLKKYPNKIRYFYQKNAGQGNACNLGIQESRGEFVAFLDADDLWVREKLEKQLKEIREKNLDLCYSDAEYFGEGRLSGKKFSDLVEFFTGREVLKELIKNNFIVNSSVVLKRSLIETVGPQNERLKRARDYEYWLRTAILKFNFGFVNMVLVRFRVDSGYSSKNKRKTLLSLIYIYLKLLSDKEIYLQNLFGLVVRMILVNLKTLLFIK